MKTFKNKVTAGIILSAVLSFFAGTQIANAQKFVLPVLPDTQVEVRAKPEMFYSQLNWLVQKKDSLKLPMVLHVGDIVDFDNVSHYETASKGFKILDSAQVGYALAVGNHDTEAVGENSGSAAPGNVNQNLRKTTKFNSYFPVSRFTMQKGRYEENKSDNAYYTFKAGKLKWLVLTLEFCARQGPVDWANKVIAANSKHNVIILTHFHLTSKGEINQTNAGYGDLTTQAIYDKMIRKHKNVRMVLSGHVVTSATRVDKGEHGNNIYQILQNYQSLDSGGGYIRLLEIDRKAKTISGKMYSPYYKTEKDDASKFTFTDVDFLGKK
ncbi:MAG: metallophosphoesterase [Adhaeribacter sp.]|nr:metallophosphoesterase [Adhaeribacter sp.]